MPPSKHTQKEKPEKISYALVKKIIQDKCLKNKSKEKILIKPSDIASELKIRYNIEVTSKTVRNYGITHRGYFEKAYSKSCTYKHKGNNQYKGLVVKPEKYLEQINEQ